MGSGTHHVSVTGVSAAAAAAGERRPEVCPGTPGLRAVTRSREGSGVRTRVSEAGLLSKRLGQVGVRIEARVSEIRSACASYPQSSV